MMTNAKREAQRRLRHPKGLFLMGAEDATGAMFGPAAMGFTAVQDAANVIATRAAAQAADQALQVATGQYRAGVTTFLQVTTAQTTAAQADVAAVTALFAYQSALAALQNAQGLSILASTPGGGS